MTRRILSLLLALCLVVGLLPMIALAEEAETKTASLTVASGNTSAPANWAPKMSEGMNASYAKTVDGLITTSGASEADYNLKAEWPVGGKPTLTLKDATINNDHFYPNKKDTITIDGTADFVVQVKGTNVLNCYPANSESMNHKISAYKCPFGIRSDTTGELTIRGEDMTKDSLAIHSWGGNGFTRYYGDTVIENLDFLIKLYKDANASSYSAHGLLLMCGKSGNYNDKTNLTVRGCNFYIDCNKNYGAKLIVVGVDNDEASSTNTSDILFQNSIVSFNRNNSSGQSAASITHGSGTTITFDRCDTGSTFYSWRVIFAYMPTIINYATATYSQEISSSSAKTYDYDPELAGTSVKIRRITTTHACLPGEPVLEKAGDCAVSADTVTYCTVPFCGKEVSREATPLEPSKAHTPGNKTLVKQTNAVLTTNSVAYQPGTYQWQYTCSACGATWEETEEFNPGVMWYIKPSNDYYSYTQKNPETGTNETIKVLTTPAYQFNSYWASNRYTPTHTIQPGTTLYFQTLDNKNANIPTNSYLIQTTDAAIIANGTWNVKVEYPVGGNPVMTLNNADLTNCAGIWWGYTRHYDLAPLTIVLKGDNYISQPRYTNGGALNLDTKADVTITGDGTLNISAIGNYPAIRSYRGDIIFDHVNVNVVNTTEGSCGNAIDAIGGDIIIDGGNFTMTGTYTNTGEAYHGLNAAGNIVIKGGANVSLTQALSTNSYFMLNAGGDVIISESTVKLACGYRGYAIKYGGELKLEYANGFTANSIHEDTNMIIEKDEETGEETNRYYQYPDLTDADVLTTAEQVAANLSRRYLDIAPNKALENFTGTSVTIKEDLDVSFKMDAAKVDTEGTVKFTVNGKEIEKNLSEVGVTEENDYVITLPGLSAKQMRDEITVTVYDSEGNTLTETKSDSVVNYALRLLRDDKYAEDNAINNALKTFVADMLVYGSMAQIRFGQPGEALVTDVLTATEWNYVTAAAPEATKTPATTSTAGYIGTSFELKSNIGMAIALDATILTDVASAKVTFTDYLGKSKEFTVATKDATSTSKYTVFVFNELAAANGRQEITWTFYNTAGEVVMTVVDSLANYVGRMRAAHPYVDDLLKYCDSAKTYFTLLNAQ